MCDIEVCRICLRNHSKFYHFDDYNLKKCYVEITNKSINKKDELPPYFCYECAALLHKFHTFREKCEYGEKVLRDMLWNGSLTNAEIHKLNAEQRNKSKFLTLDILVSSKYVKTFIFHDQEMIKTEVVKDFTEGSFTDNENCASENLECDPVNLDTFSYDVCVKEEEENSAENTIETVHVEEKLIENNNIEDTVTNTLALRNLDKPKGTKSRKKRQSKRINKQKLKQIDSDEKTDDFEYKIKSVRSTVILEPKTKKTYKFNRPRNSKKRHEFLNNLENWKKSRLSDDEAIEEFQKKALDMKYLKAPYKCELCYLGFSQKSMLDRHIPRRHDESVGPAMCHFCKIRFKCQGLVNHHLRQHYNKYECLRCGLVCCVADSALLHEESHSGVKRKCPHCDKEFRHLSSFYTHLRTHRSKHVCSLCGDSFVSKLGLRQHRTIKHRAEMKKKVVDVEEAVYCEVCQINFESTDAYQNHLDHSDMHTDETKNKLGANFVAEIVAAQEKIEAKDGTYTHVSGLVNRKSMVEKELCAVRKSVNTWKFGKKRNPQERIIKPKAPKVARKPTACKHCNSTFETVKACMIHHQSHHRGKPFNPQRVVCEVCGASLAAGSVSAHINKHTPNPNVTKPRKKTLTGKNTYTCDTCGHSFKTSNLLKVHQAKHTGERNYPCTLCDKRYTHSGSLSLHYRTIHLKLPYPKRNRNKRKIDKEEECPAV